MTECLVLPIMAAAVPATLAEPAIEAGDTPTDFTLEEIVPEDLPDPPEAEAALAGAAPPDPLQRLIEDLSGITGALREAVPATDQPAVADADAALTDATPRTALPGAVTGTIDALPHDKAPAAAVDTVRTDPATVEIERLAADAAPIAPAPRDDGVVPADLRAARPVVVPVARQIAEAVVTARDGMVEIALAPEELGRIRIVMSGPDHSPHVVVWVERPEVLDQLRRNAGFLQECLGDAGMADASLEFHGDTSSGSRDDRRGNATPGRPVFDAADPIPSVPIAWTPMAISARLDIRI